MAEESNNNKIAKCAEELKSILADQKIDFSHLETPRDICEFGTKFLPNRITPLHPHPLIRSNLDYNCKTTEWSCSGCQSDQARQEKNWPRFQCSQCDVNYCSNCINKKTLPEEKYKHPLHSHVLSRNYQRSQWRCGGFVGGLSCKNACNDLTQVLPRWSCKRCDFDLCEKCSKIQFKIPVDEVKPVEEVKPEVKPEVHEDLKERPDRQEPPLKEKPKKQKKPKKPKKPKTNNNNDINTDEDTCPPSFLCPISTEIMSDPVLVVESGMVYDRTSIETWFVNNSTDPLTGAKIASKMIVPVLTLKNAIEEWKSINKNKESK